jgi:hypothetical protein
MIKLGNEFSSKLERLLDAKIISSYPLLNCGRHRLRKPWAYVDVRNKVVRW